MRYGMGTGERTGAAKLKWVVIVDRALPPGQAVNAAVCVSAATARAVAGLLGRAGSARPGSGSRPARAGSSILAGTATELAAVRQQAPGPPAARGGHAGVAQATRV